MQADDLFQNKHYRDLKPQTIERLQEILSPEEFQGFCRGNIHKYNERFEKKEKRIAASRKILDYAIWLHESLTGKKVSVY